VTVEQGMVTASTRLITPAVTPFDARGDLMLDALAALIRRQHDLGLVVWLDADYLIGAALLAGVDGVVSTLANLVPERVAGLVRAARMGEIEETRKLQRWVGGMADLVATDLFISRLKAAMRIMGLGGGVCRLPRRELSSTEAETLVLVPRQWGVGT